MIFIADTANTLFAVFFSFHFESNVLIPNIMSILLTEVSRMEMIVAGIIVFTLAIFWTLLDFKEDEYIYERIDRVEDDEKAVILYKKIKV